MTPDFERAIGGMADIPQWFVWRLEWDAEHGKYAKTPCALNGAGNVDAGSAANWHDYDAVVAAVRALPVSTELRYALGFRLTADCGYWFLDLDHAEGVPLAQQFVAAYPGAMVERSSSGKGLHVIGMGSAPVGHRTRPERDVAASLLPLQLEFYTKGRGIAFGLDGVASGCADTRFDVGPLVERYFPMRVAGSGVARLEWRGPADDDLLIERMLGARMSAAAAFGHKASVGALWRGEVEQSSEADMALASHLAFWTGCDEERMERLMWRSGLVRDKWRQHRTYLAITIANAVAGCENVYKEPERNLAVQGALYAAPSEQLPLVTVVPANAPVMERISSDTFARVQALLDDIASCGDELTLHNEVIPRVQQAGVPMALQERLVTEVRSKLHIWGNKMAVSRIRALMFPPTMRSASADALPEWAQPFVYVSTIERFFNTHNTTEVSVSSFHATYGRYMPVGDSGRRDNAAERCLHFWNIPIVERIGYRPDCGPHYEWEGVSYANLYSPTSLPVVTVEYSEAGLVGIAAFQSMLYDMCGHRDDVFQHLLYWMAHNVQKPGVKIRWSPILKGVHGDGKTLACAVLRAAMGMRNVSTTSNSNIANSGGFTDWAVRGAVNIIEEIMLTGKQRHQLYNAMKEFITNNITDINPKGDKPYQAWNCTNHIALTNHNDALPMEKTDRRWMVVFTPWSSLGGMMTYCGLDAAGWKARTDRIDHAKNHCAGELRAWFLSLAIPEWFDISGSALVTPEKQRMMASSTDSAESVAMSIITAGSVGISESVVSSSHLSRMLNARSQLDGFDMPKGTALNHMFTRLGYSKVEKQIKWLGQTYTIWLKDGVEFTNEQIREALDFTRVGVATSNLPQT